MLAENHSDKGKERFKQAFRKKYGQDCPQGTEQCLLDGMIINGIKRVKHNYRTVVPQLFTDKNNKGRGKLQLLIPLYFDAANSNVPDLVLAVEKHRKLESTGNDPSCFQYVGNTLLDMQMALNNARLLCRVESEWLVRPVSTARSPPPQTRPPLPPGPPPSPPGPPVAGGGAMGTVEVVVVAVDMAAAEEEVRAQFLLGRGAMGTVEVVVVAVDMAATEEEAAGGSSQKSAPYETYL